MLTKQNGDTFKGVPEKYKVMVCESFLDGRAKFWADTVNNMTQTYTEFKTQQYPIKIREALSTVDSSCTSAMAQALA